MVTDRSAGSDATLGYDSGTAAPRNLLSRIKLGHVIMALAAILALLFNLAVLRGNQSTTEVVVAGDDIRAGTALTMSHFEIAEVPSNDLLTGRFVAWESAEAAVGRLATRSIPGGEPVLESDLLVVENRDGLRAMSIPIEPSQAVAGQLSVGDSVDIVMVLDGVATYIATGIEVLDVPASDSNALGARTGYAPTVSVDGVQALRIAAALDTGEVHIVRSTGSALPELEQARAVTSSDEEEAGT